MAPAWSEESLSEGLIGDFEFCEASRRQVANIDGLADCGYCLGVFAASVHSYQRDGLDTEHPGKVDRHVAGIVDAPQVLRARELGGIEGQEVVVVARGVPEAAPCPGWGCPVRGAARAGDYPPWAGDFSQLADLWMRGHSILAGRNGCGVIDTDEESVCWAWCSCCQPLIEGGVFTEDVGMASGVVFDGFLPRKWASSCFCPMSSNAGLIAGCNDAADGLYLRAPPFHGLHSGVQIVSADGYVTGTCADGEKEALRDAGDFLEGWCYFAGEKVLEDIESSRQMECFICEWQGSSARINICVSAGEVHADGMDAWCGAQGLGEFIVTTADVEYAGAWLRAFFDEGCTMAGIFVAWEGVRLAVNVPIFGGFTVEGFGRYPPVEANVCTFWVVRAVQIGDGVGVCG